MPDESAAAPPARPAAGPELQCDIVMKGGITSGVVYPRAITELAKTFRFRNIGGTSAGAIAAAAAAAAEYSRRHGNAGTGFTELDGLPQWLGKDSGVVAGSRLFALFQPQRGTLPLFSILSAGLKREGRIARVVRAALTQFAGSALLGAAPGLAIALAGWLWADQAGRWIASLAGGLLALIGAAAGVVCSLVRNALRELPANRFGMCSGLEGAGYDGAPALTPWLTALLDRIAGIPETARPLSPPAPAAEDGAARAPMRQPLTFGDLWGTRDEKADHDVELQFVTTNLTHGKPHRLPYDTTGLYFDPVELGDYFPAWVVEWMVANPRTRRRRRKTLDFTRNPRLRPLPDPCDLPVVVAARMSLSFPFLISAVPLYAVDFTRERVEDRTQERCWFSDGGLCSNFPVHFFDQPLPGWPTFAINLRDEHPDHRIVADEALNSYLPDDNRGGIEEWWNRFDAGTGARRLGGFVGAMLSAAKDWHDNVQLQVPGYRDRVVHVALAPDEGGLNLNMPERLITRLGDRGCQAVAKLARRFAPPGEASGMGWDNHRWIRFRSTLLLLEEELREIRETLDAATPAGASYRELIARPDPPSYDWGSEAQRQACLEWVERLLDDGFLKQDALTFETKAPRPRPVQRIVPRF
ncbi:MAG TPA: patatin-like phospholipase family protein [Longimicrobium sp.]